MGKQKLYDLRDMKDDEIGKINCHQPRGYGAPNKKDILSSLYRGSPDKADFVLSRACNITFNCKFSWDSNGPNPEADYPFSGGTTCIMAGGAGPRHTTHHEVIVQKLKEDQELGDWCVGAVSALIDKCMIEGEYYGGFWGDEKGRRVNISNTAWLENSLDGVPLPNFPQVPSYNPKPNWDSEYLPFETAMKRLKEA
ncbi:hypothetical protein B0J11DRAFT_602227 [Dendryphion nanum]|uniref:Uncharacterized protein n=1 Tax=Dendryphion nanum TaxID=256645 RepID=A0A9P9E3P1_9PLEO|nr:hypothetical protein B0J11DRAFT_602227 [Dendryphion nanum]